MTWRYCFALVALAVVIAGCSDRSSSTAPQRSSAAQETTNVFQVKGVIEELNPEELSVRIRHEEIPGYMKAMSMEFDVRHANELQGLKPGDVVSFRMLVTETDGWIERIQKLGGTPPAELPSRPTFRPTRDVELLEIGDAVPSYTFTNQFGKAIHLEEFKGQALAVNFIFTTCPFPTFCPLVSRNFMETQAQLLRDASAPTNWHLLTVTIDPQTDTPAVLKSYAERHEYNPKHWSFVTGDLIEITALADHFGQTFYRESGTINHNLRTAVIDTEGRLQHIFQGNKWTSEDLVPELIRAAQRK